MGIDGNGLSPFSFASPYIKTFPGQTTPINQWKDVVYTYEGAIALTDDGRVFEWGSATGSTDYIPVPITFPVSVVIDKIYGHSGRGSSTAISWFAISTTGELYGWRDNTWGQLGLGNTTAQSTPQLIQGDIAGKVITKLSVSSNNGMHVACIDSTGQLYTWGYNTNAQGGNAIGLAGLPGSRITPYTVPNMSDVVDVMAVGCYNANVGEVNMTRVLKSDGTTWACGRNIFGELATGNTTPSEVFVQESTLSTDFIKMFRGNMFQGVANAVIKNDGKVYFSGRNNDNCFGNGIANNSANTQFINTAQLDNAGFQGKMLENGNGIVPKVGFSGTNDIGYGACFVLDNTGQLWACGTNYGGLLGTGDIANITLSAFKKCTIGGSIPVIDFRVVGLNQEGAGIIVILQDGSMWSAGYEVNGSLGTFYTVTNVSLISFRPLVGFEPNSKN
jgi:alpha-tubulin suppressor-like RCC1 family protein